MRQVDVARLSLLAAIWGGSFIFIRVSAPAVGPLWMADIRVLLGGLALVAWLRFSGRPLGWRQHARLYAAVGFANSALPFTLYGFAGLSLSAATMAFLNATSPMFSLLLGAALGAERLTARKALGLLAGAAGVALVAGPSGAGSLAPVAACLGASFSYGVAGVIVKRYGAHAPAGGIAAGSQLAAALMLAPLLPLAVPQPPSGIVIANLAALGILASGVALLLYFRLMRDIGATRALTVTFLVPLFAFGWAAVFLGEPLTLAIAVGGLLILIGTLLVTRG
ncbi:MAG: DMT family transporter [Betaproteobacteria bacterium]|nr:DMT family transporter [Betaproteobacteria bacterium]